MIIMNPPVRADHGVPLMRFVLESTGREVRPDVEAGNIVRALTEAEALELEADGWTRRADKVLDADTLRKIMSTETVRTGIGAVVAPRAASVGALVRDSHLAELRHFGKGSEPPRRAEFGQLDAGKHGRLMTSYDQSSDVLQIHGVNVELDALDPDLADGVRAMAAMHLQEMQDARQQAGISAVLGALLESIINRHDFVSSAVRQVRHHQRFGT